MQPGFQGAETRKMCQIKKRLHMNLVNKLKLIRARFHMWEFDVASAIVIA